jgi:ectoine hydroxylase-related dioxygenase (phytanoyl-CoA dioxygenase family)
MFAERFTRDGCLVVDRLFDPMLIDAVRAEVERQHGDIDPGRPPEHLEVGHMRLQVPIDLKGPLLDPAVYAHPLLMTMLRPLLGDGLVIDNITCVIAFPGAEEQHLHRDHPDLFDQVLDLPPYAITVAVPLIDLSEETGTTRLYPGSMDAMRGADGKPTQLPEPVTPLIARGGCMLVDYRLWHRGTANRSRVKRPILYLIYTRPWFTDFRNFKRHAAIALDRESLRHIPREHRPLFQRAAGKGRLDMTVKEFLSC